jgi:hypothetical protein
MKKNLSVLFIGLILSLFFFSCASVEYSEEVPSDKMPGPGESLVTVQRSFVNFGGLVSMKIWIDNEEAAGSIKRGVRSFIVIPDGTHTIQTGTSNLDRGNTITFTVSGEEIIFMANPAMGFLSARFNLTETGRRKIN